MTEKAELTAQQRAEQKRSAQRRGTPTFAAVRFSNGADRTAEQKKAYITSVIEAHGGTREAALLEAFEALEKTLK